MTAAEPAGSLAAVRAAPGYWYVASPYSKYPAGIQAAFVDICKVTAALLREGISVFSPIAHSHPVAMAGEIDPLNYSVWLPTNEALMDAAHGIIVVQMVGWDDSYGVGIEIKRFAAAGKSIIYLDPRTLERRAEREGKEEGR